MSQSPERHPSGPARLRGAWCVAPSGPAAFAAPGAWRVGRRLWETGRCLTQSERVAASLALLVCAASSDWKDLVP